MRDLKHTQGKWIKAKVNRFNIVDEGGNIIASANCNYLIEDVEAEANAKLIAAAPDLLEACIKLATELTDEVTTEEQAQALYDLAQKVIKKATE